MKDFHSHLLLLYYLKILYLFYAAFSATTSKHLHSDEIVPTAGVIEEGEETGWLTANLAAVLIPSVTVFCLGGLALLLVRKLCCNCKTCPSFVRLVSHELWQLPSFYRLVLWARQAINSWDPVGGLCFWAV